MDEISRLLVFAALAMSGVIVGVAGVPLLRSSNKAAQRRRDGDLTGLSWAAIARRDRASSLMTAYGAIVIPVAALCLVLVLMGVL